MKIIKYILGQLQTNCYFLINNNKDCLIIDPADEANFILEELSRNNLNLIGMLATHGHFDHIMGVGEIQKILDINFYINEKDKFLLDRIEERAEYFLGYKPIIMPIKKIRSFNKEGLFKIADWQFKVLFTPGHTPGSVAFYFEKEKFLFSGDLLFKKTVGRYDFSYSNKKDLIDSLKKIFKLPLTTIVYPGHGEATNLKQEKENINLIFSLKV